MHCDNVTLYGKSISIKSLNYIYVCVCVYVNRGNTRARRHRRTVSIAFTLYNRESTVIETAAPHNRARFRQV